MPEPRIRQLDEATANQIAAGEVVERPASVVKELLENSVDAGATRIALDVEEGGTQRIRVTDDGQGMGPEDAKLSLQRHATSKIRSVHDLLTVCTMGFRGEALPSIASVSRFTLTTRPADQEEGFRVIVEGGHLRSEEAVGAAVGTTVEVEDLFFNVPARKKFLKRPATELSHIQDAVVRLTLAHPRIAFRLKHGDRVLIDAPPMAPQDPKGRLARVLGRKLADGLYAIPAGPEGPVQVSGYAAQPTVSERTTRGQFVFVNGRFVRDRTIQHAIQEGYRTLMEKGRYPVVILDLRVDPATFDVNVHPQKIEVRFAQTGDVHRAVTSALRRTLLDQPWLQSGQYAVEVARSATPGTNLGVDRGVGRDVGRGVDLGVDLGVEPSSRGSGSSTGSSMESSTRPPTRSPSLGGAALVRDRDDKGLSAFVGRPVIRVPSVPSPRPASADPERGLFQAQPAARGRFSRLTPIGQVLGTYLVCEGDGEMVVIDQHAAHERIAFQRMREQQQRARVTSQPLLMPIPLELDARRAETAERYGDRFGALGFELAPFGGRTWLVKATPTALAGADIERLVLDLLDELASFETTSAFEDQVDALLSCAACHRVVRAGDRLTPEEIRALLVQMDEIDFGAHCPHGRPVFVEWSSADLARLFHRT